MGEKDLLIRVIDIAQKAGHKIMDVYDSRYDVQQKKDGSLLTTADQLAHNFISKQLGLLTPHIPLVSEESIESISAERQNWQCFWLIDPLDGTKEFVSRNGEFTVNIALVEGAQPTLGVVYVPAQRLAYYACCSMGAWRQFENQPPERISTKPYNGGIAKMASSRSHAGGLVDRFRTALEVETGDLVEVVVLGSSLKICLVATGEVDVYPRLGTTSEWDTGAAQCVLVEAGGSILNCDGGPLRYNKRDLRNPWFIAAGDLSYDWVAFCPSRPDKPRSYKVRQL